LLFICLEVSLYSLVLESLLLFFDFTLGKFEGFFRHKTVLASQFEQHLVLLFFLALGVYVLVRRILGVLSVLRLDLLSALFGPHFLLGRRWLGLGVLAVFFLDGQLCALRM
jgi:hypothetical protein